MNKRLYTFINIVLVAVAGLLIFELTRSANRVGDFNGYLHVGKMVLSGEDIYTYYGNTWPPFFSVFSVLIAWAGNIGEYLIRFLWILGSYVAMFFVIQLTVKMVLGKTLSFRKGGGGLMVQDPIVLIPLLFSVRFILDNTTNIQINIYMLLCVVLCVYFFIQKRYAWLGAILALTISMKVYTIFLLLYFLFKRELKPVAWTLLFLVIFNSITFLVFGVDQAIEFYKTWANEVVSRGYMANHKSQSLFSMFLRFLTEEDPTHDMYVNFLSLEPKLVKYMTYATIALASLYPAFLLRRKLESTHNMKAFLEYSLVFTAIPLLAPISWKAYFIFLWFPYFMLYLLLFRTETSFSRKTQQLMKGAFWLSIALTLFTAQIFVGRSLARVFEAYSAITIGVILLVFIQLFVIMKLKNFDLNRIRMKTLEEHSSS